MPDDTCPMCELEALRLYESAEHTATMRVVGVEQARVRELRARVKELEATETVKAVAKLRARQVGLESENRCLMEGHTALVGQMEAQMAKLEARVVELGAQLAAAQKGLCLVASDVTRDEVKATYRAGFVPVLAAVLAEEFVEHGGTNFVGFDVAHPTLGVMRLSLQRAEGKTPEHVAAEWRERGERAEAQVEDLMARADTAEARVDELEADNKRLKREKAEALDKLEQVEAQAAALREALEACAEVVAGGGGFLCDQNREDAPQPGCDCPTCHDMGVLAQASAALSPNADEALLERLKRQIDHATAGWHEAYRGHECIETLRQAAIWQWRRAREAEALLAWAQEVLCEAQSLNPACSFANAVGLAVCDCREVDEHEGRLSTLVAALGLENVEPWDKVLETARMMREQDQVAGEALAEVERLREALRETTRGIRDVSTDDWSDAIADARATIWKALLGPGGQS